MSEEGWLWFIAGPNGAGKTTRAHEFFSGIGVIVNPDEIAKELSESTSEKSLASAACAAIERRQQLLDSGQTFSIETTLSGRTVFRFAETARQKGWKIGLHIGLRSAEHAIERVQLRVKSGGHNVSPDEVRRRYSRSLANLGTFVPLADYSIFIDNSSRRPRMLLQIVENSVSFRAARIPTWLATSLPQATTRGKRRRRP